MHMKLSRAGMYLVVLCGSASLAMGADQTYPIKMDRPFKVGDAYEVHVVIDTSNHDTRLTAGATTAEKRDLEFQGELSGRVDIVGVDKKGNDTVFSVTVTKFTMGADKKELVASGKIIDVARSSREVNFSLRGGGTLSDEAKFALSQVYQELNSSDVSDDEVFGSKTPRKVGESWPLNSEAAAKQAAGAGIDADPKQLTGETKLEAVETVRGVQAVRLDTKVNMAKARPSNPPPTIKIQDSDLKMEVITVFSTEGTLPPLEVEKTMDTSSSLVNSSPSSVITSKGHQHQKISITPIKK
jgi:hypothetical protein